jgi:nucleoside-diphosphate-sugar epimerase
LLTSPRFLYVSSTSVYGQTDGSVVTESSPTDPVEESGRVVLEAEGVLRAAVPDAIVLRFAGIYGPDRVLRRQALLAGEPLVGDADKWLNLIHVEDGVRAVLAAEARGRPGATYLVADGTPVRRRDFYTRAAELLGAPPAAFDHRPAQGEANRRIDAGTLRTACGFEPEFKSYREGLVQSVGHTPNTREDFTSRERK